MPRKAKTAAAAPAAPAEPQTVTVTPAPAPQPVVYPWSIDRRPLPTPPIKHQGYSYTVDGTLPTSKDGKGQYFYAIYRSTRSGTVAVVAQSEPTYDLITAAGQAARKASETMTAITPPTEEEDEGEVLPTTKIQRDDYEEVAAD